MKRKTVLVGILIIMLGLFGCGQKPITLNFAFGERTGIYQGELQDGLPHGFGQFRTKESDGVSWQYKGEWLNGHFEGAGTLSWSNGRVEKGLYKQDKIVPLKGEETEGVFDYPMDYRDYAIELSGQISSRPIQRRNSLSFNLLCDEYDITRQAVIVIENTDLSVKDGDYLNLTGIVGPTYHLENAFGKKIIVPSIKAKTVEITTYQESIRPTLKSVEVNQTISQYGYVITVGRVEFAAKETRVYVKLENQSNGSFGLIRYLTKIIQNKKQYEEQQNIKGGYPDIPIDLTSGVSAEAIITFPPIEIGSFKLILHGSIHPWMDNFNEYIFPIIVEEDSQLL